MERLNKAPFLFIGGSYLARSRTFDCARTVNLYPEMNDQGGGKNGEVAALYSTPGLRKVQEIGLGPIRGAYTSSQSNVCFIVSGNELYQLSSAEGIPVVITGNLNTSIGPISMVDNGEHLLIVDGSNGYTVPLLAPVISVIDDPNFYNGAQTVTYQGGYFILDVPNSSNFFISDIDSIDFPPLNESSALSSPDNVVAVISNNEQLYVLGSKTIETWTLTGASASAPFSLSPGQVINMGVTAVATVRKLAATFFWLGGNDQGEGVVYSMENNSPTRVSNHAIEFRLQQLGDLSSSTAFSYQRDGHYFYELNVPGSNTTWVYDMSTKQWHERQSIASGVIGRHLGQVSCFLAGEHIIGDYRNGNVYVYDYECFEDNGQPLRRIRQTAHSSSGVAMVFYKTLQVDIQPGTGTSTIDPRLVLEVSRDGGHTFGNPIYGTMGKIGNYVARARWQRLGRGRDLVFRVSCDDPVNVVLLGAYLDVEQGTS